MTINALRKGQLLLLLDGLDEVPSRNQDKLVEAINYFAKRYHHNRFIVSCRIAAYKHNLELFANAKILCFDDRKIENFIHNWFGNLPNRSWNRDQDRSTAQKFWELLQKPENRSCKELARTPLLLTLICLV